MLSFVMPKKANKKAVSVKKPAANTQKTSKPAKSEAAKPKAKVAKAPKAKAPVKKKATASKGRGKRYTPAQKAKVLAYVDEVNAKQGRGGAAAASRKFGISQITIGQWAKKSGSKSAAKPVAKKAKRGRKPAANKGAGFSAKLRRLADVHEGIIKAKADLASLEAEYTKLKKSL